MQFKNAGKSFQIKRYPPTSQRSLQAWNAADEHILNHLSEVDMTDKQISIYHDRFGFLACTLHERSALSIATFKSQTKAIEKNLKANKLEAKDDALLGPIDDVAQKLDLAIIKVPKALDLFRLYLHQASQSLNEEGQIICGLYDTPLYGSDAQDSRAILF